MMLRITCLVAVGTICLAGVAIVVAVDRSQAGQNSTDQGVERGDSDTGPDGKTADSGDSDPDADRQDGRRDSDVDSDDERHPSDSDAVQHRLKSDRPGDDVDRQPADLERAERERLRKYDPEMFEMIESDEELQMESFELAELYRRAKDPDEREEIRKDVSNVVAKHFNVRQNRRELEVKRMEQELDRLARLLERRERLREMIINKRIVDLLGDDSLDF